MEHIYDVLILGGGPAGLAAGIYAARSRLDTLLVEKGQSGGQIALTAELENYPGQLLEGETGLTESLVIGAGVNVSQTPEDFGPEVAAIATSLAQEGYPVSRPALAAAMIEAFCRLGDCLGGDTAAWVDAYRRDCVTLGRDVRLLWTDGQARAKALDIDEQFGLVVRLEDGTETTVRTGEVSVRGLYGYTE